MKAQDEVLGAMGLLKHESRRDDTFGVGASCHNHRRPSQNNQMKSVEVIVVIIATLLLWAPSELIWKGLSALWRTWRGK